MTGVGFVDDPDSDPEELEDERRSTDDTSCRRRGARSVVSLLSAGIFSAALAPGDRSVVEGNVIKNEDIEDEEEERKFRRRFVWVIIGFVVIGIVVALAVPFSVQPAPSPGLTQEPTPPPPSSSPSSSPQPTISPTMAPTLTPWEEISFPLQQQQLLVGGPLQRFGTSVAVSNDVNNFLAVASAGGRGSISVYRVFGSERTVIAVGSPIDLGINNLIRVTVKISDDGSTVAAAASSRDGTGTAKVFQFLSQRWILHRELSGEAPERGISLDMSPDGVRVVVAWRFIVRVYDVSSSPVRQLGSDFTLRQGKGSRTVVSLTQRLLGIGEENGKKSLVALYRYNVLDDEWVSASSTVSGPNTLDDGGPFHDGFLDSIATLSEGRDSVLVYDFNTMFAGFIARGGVIPLGRILADTDWLHLEMVGLNTVVIGWDAVVSIYDFEDDVGSWVQRGGNIDFTTTEVGTRPPAITRSFDQDRFIAVGLESDRSSNGSVRIFGFPS